MGKGEIACYEQFLLFPQCFREACFPEASKGVTVWEWVKLFPSDKILDYTIPEGTKYSYKANLLCCTDTKMQLNCHTSPTLYIALLKYTLNQPTLQKE